MEIATIVVQFFLSLSLLIVLHELGHFIAARIFGTRVEKFYLFFNPGFSLFKKKIGETEYGIGWLPLGGYVKIAGMVDESLDRAQLQKPPQPWEFRSKPAWQRLTIMLGGVTVNFILGFLIFGLLYATYGEKYIPADAITEGIYVDSIGQAMGLRDGDIILRIGDKPFERFDKRQLIRGIVLENARSITVLRNGQEVEIPIDDHWVAFLSSHRARQYAIFGPRLPLIVDSVLPGMPAHRAGIRKGDRLIAVDTTPVHYIHEYFEKVKTRPNTSYLLTLVRNGDTVQLQLQTDQKGKFGIFWQQPPLRAQRYPLYKALPLGVVRGWQFLKDQLVGFSKMFSGEIKASESLGGFATIAQLFPPSWNWEHFWRTTAVLSLILGFMNLLPIPALDGGHVMFLLYEMITGRKPSEKVIEILTLLGMIFLAGLLIWVNWLDIARIFNK